MANVYYSDTLGTNLNVFEKKTKGGDSFYYIYLNKDKINDKEVGKLTKIMQDVLPNASIKTKKGKIAYQISWSYNSPTPLTAEKTFFEEIFSYLSGYGYMDDYQPKAKKSGQTKLKRVGVVPPPAPAKTEFKVGDTFRYLGSVIKKNQPAIYEVSEISDDKIYLINFEQRGSQFFWVTTDLGKEMIKDGEIEFINTSTPSNKIIISKISTLEIDDLFQNQFEKLYRVVKIVADNGLEYIEGKIENLTDSTIIILETYNKIKDDFVRLRYSLKELNEYIEIGRFEFFGKVKNGDKFINSTMERDVINVDANNDVTFNITIIGALKPSDTDYLTLKVFITSLLRQNYKFHERESLPQINTIQPPQAMVSDTEIDALKKDLGDLLFLKTKISDLDFEEKINISTDISDLQKKIDNLNEKIFEQVVGDYDFFDRLFDQSFTPLKNRYDMVITTNTSPEILSPSGEISDFDEELQRIINSKEFKEWFGDWRNAFFYRNLEDFGGLNVSKVLNSKFEPQLVWHGTNNEFSYFDFENFPANYFAVNREYSEFFAINKGTEGYVLPFFLNIKNPLDLSEFGIENVSTKDFFDWMYLMTGMTPEQLEINPLFLDPSAPPSPIWVYIRNNPTMLKKISDGNVFDGIKFYEFNPNADRQDKLAYETLAYIVFNPHQVKLADPSRGDIMLASLKSFMLKRGGKI
jgi:hypothetical protein